MEALKKQRKLNKHKITRLATWVDQNKDKITDILEYQTREKDLISYYQAYTESQDEIEELDVDNQDQENRDDTENRYYQILSTFKRKINELSCVSVTRNSSISQGLSSQGNIATMSNVKLPDLNIPVFKGNFTEWGSFSQLFKAVIIDNQGLSDVQKLIYLKSLVQAEPYNLIDNLQLIDSNFKLALGILEDRYSNKVFTINAHIKELIDIQPVTKINAKNLREFLTNMKQQIEALSNLNLQVDSLSEVIIIYLLSQKLDYNLRKSFESERDRAELPKLSQFYKFLENKCEILESVSTQSEPKVGGNKPKYTATHAGFSNGTFNLPRDKNCFYCNISNHFLSRCTKFNKLPHSQKLQFLYQNKKCTNCLGSHKVSECQSKHLCNVCKKNHHTILHIYPKGPTQVHPPNITFNTPQSHSHNNSNPSLEIPGQNEASGVSQTPNVNFLHKTQPTPNSGLSSENKGQTKRPDRSSFNSVSHTSFCQNNAFVLLATAQVVLRSKNGKKLFAKALIDTGSQCSFISESLVNALSLDSYDMLTNVSVISNNTTTVSKMVDLTVYSNSYPVNTLDVSCLVLKEITSNLPQIKLNISKLPISADIKLADPTFYEPSQIDILLGAQAHREIIRPDIIDLGKGLPILQNTSFGYIVSGAIANQNNHSLRSSNASFFVQIFNDLDTINGQINDFLPKFWSLEEVENKKILSREDKKCEKIFENTTKILENGHFQVNLPFNNDTDFLKLGDSFSTALKRFLYLEQKFIKNPELFLEYKDFIDEYVKLGHARYVPLDIHNNQYFMAHHCVIRELSVSTKLRVVYDASMKTTTNISLNDILLKGYTVQPELFDILCRFRSSNFVFICDIEKMYRQIMVNPSQCFLQNILWREHPDLPLKQIELTTVTYGTSSAPYLATRCLVELANKNKELYPLASNAILNQCYLDDFLCFSSSESELKLLSKELVALCQSAGFKLHKWSSNSKIFLESLNQDIAQLNYNISLEECSSKVLGISWNPRNDSFTISLPKNVSDLKMFDPLGFLGPVILRAKCFMQKLWKARIDWDELLPENLSLEWKEFIKNYSELSNVKIPRCLFYKAEIIKAELFGFSDASQSAYGACVYVRATYVNQHISCQLITSKSRVAPIKTITLPRLELCGASLLSKLSTRVVSIFKDVLHFETLNLFCDSQIVLSWLNSDPSRWNTYVANRVSEIQELTSNKFKWYYVPTNDNPADLVSRGLNPDEIKHCDKWWHGPMFLRQSNFDIQKYIFDNKSKEISEELKKQNLNVNMHISTKSDLEQYFQKFSSFSKLQRVFAYVLRFVNNIKAKQSSQSHLILQGTLTVKELQNSLHLIIKHLQEKYFHKEMTELKSNKQISSNVLKPLKPFLDKNGCLRVGGRLSQAEINYNQKHPLLLPSKNHVVYLMLTKEHLSLCHAGTRTVLANFRLKYWPLNGLRTVKKIVRNCVTCHRFRAHNTQQVMSDLPKDRLTTVRPFHKVGVDYGGPFFVKSSNIRRAKLVKCYIAIFVCMATKAVHIELVSSLSTDGFLLTLKRFIARRGNPSVIYSDNGTNFVGSRNYLYELRDLFKIQENSEIIQNFLSNLEIQWKFIPARSPHWGGLWEAAIKSAKFHIARILGNSHLTFEELSTVLSQIESVLNSRPLCPLSEDPSDPECLTPGHFLIGSSLNSFPERDISDMPINRLSRWQHCTKLYQHFWKRWSIEYLNSLQRRSKWHSETENIKIGTICLLKEDNTPPLIWPMARVVEVYPGKDNKIRAVKLKTKDGFHTRPITKLCPLPITDNYLPTYDI